MRAADMEAATEGQGGIVADMQAQPGTAPSEPRSKKRFKNMAHVGIGDAAAVITKLEFHPVGVARSASNPDVLLRGLIFKGMIQGIIDHVGDDLTQRTGITMQFNGFGHIDMKPDGQDFEPGMQ